MIFTLNDSLEPCALSRRARTIEDLGRELMAEVVEQKPISLIRCPDVKNAKSVHSSLLYFLSDAYNRHWDISLAPHDLWYLVASEIAGVVNSDPKRYRDVFTTNKDGKIEILVPSFSPSVLPLESLMDYLRMLVPTDVNVWVPEFSTHTERSRMACCAAFCDTVKSYYDYGVFMCGIRSIEVLGTLEDWKLFYDNCGIISEWLGQHSIGVKSWLRVVRERILSIMSSLDGGEQGFWKDIFTQRNIGSGGELEVNGWIRDFYARPPKLAKITNFSRNWSVVPFKCVDTNQHFIDVYGCFASGENDGRMRPDYGNFTVEVLGH